MKSEVSIRERAAAISLKFVEEQSEGEWGDDLIAKDADKLTDVLCAFAADLLGFAVQECIERACAACEEGHEPSRCFGLYSENVPAWVHMDYAVGDAKNLMCNAETIHELLYRLANKEEAR